jgi:hypothetical protein
MVINDFAFERLEALREAPTDKDAQMRAAVCFDILAPKERSQANAYLSMSCMPVTFGGKAPQFTVHYTPEGELVDVLLNDTVVTSLMDDIDKVCLTRVIGQMLEVRKL